MSIWRQLRKLGYTHKKTFQYTERDELLRAQFRAELAAIPPAMLVYINETGMDNHEARSI